MDPAPLDPECSAARDDLAALAIGTLTGRERAELLDHLERCARCAAELEELSAAADALVTLIPAARPPDGFAARTMATLRAERSARRPVFWRRAAAAAVVAALGVGVGVGVGEALSSSGGAPQAVGVRTAVLHVGPHAEGTVVLSPGRYGWLVMTLDDVPTSGAVTCSVTLADGSRVVVGHFPLSEGYGSWAVQLPVAASSVRAVSVLDDRGRTVAWARLASA